MKRVVSFGFAMTILLLLASSPVSALLMKLEPSPGEFVVWDDVNKKQWISDLTMFTQMTYDELLVHIDLMNAEMYGGVDGWYLASLAEVEALAAEIQTLNDAYTFEPVAGFPGYNEWFGRVNDVYPQDPPAHYGIGWADSFGTLTDLATVERWDDIQYFYVGAWVATEAEPVAPVPEPSTMLLLGSSLLGLVGFKRKVKK
jgi:hypothetical protein